MKRCLRVLRAASIWALLLSSGEKALADESPTQKVHAANADPGVPETSGKPLETAPTSSNSEQLAALAYQKARESYAKGDIPAALDSMRESYQLSKRAELLYNLAQMESELKACPDALANYGRYLELVPNGLYRDSATQERARLEKECGPPAPTPPTPKPLVNEPHPVQPVEPPATTYWTPKRIIGWSTLSAGVIAGASAVYFEVQAVRAQNELQQSIDDAVGGGPPVDPSLQDRMHRYNHVAIGLGIASGAMVASGALVLLLDPGTTRARSASVYALPGLLGASYVQRF